MSATGSQPPAYLAHSDDVVPAYAVGDNAHPTDSDSVDKPPVYAPPSSFTIGSKTLTSPLVQVQELKAHLSLLRAFKSLRTFVEDEKVAYWPEVIHLEPPQRWAWFVGLAVDRFEKWIKTARTGTLEQEFPPLDVLMIWHAYMLNPTWYAEDCTRISALSILASMQDRLLPTLVSIGDISSYTPSAERQERWAQQTGTPFDPIAATSQMESRVVACPKCLGGIAVPYLTVKGTGYLQSSFSAVCPSCQFNVNKENLAVLKFVRDLVLDHRKREDCEKYNLGVYMAGTVRTTTTPVEDIVGSLVNVKLHSVFSPPGHGRKKITKDEWTKIIMEQVDYSMEKLHKAAYPAFHGTQRRSKRILGAYVDDRPFSVELVGAVIRQCSFIDKMQVYGWTEPGAFDSQEDQVVLQHAIARYHAFMDLMASSPATFCVPTLDIDLAWHTHQLKGEIYQNDCKQYIGRYIDHDDKVEESHLATSFDMTCRAWEARYQVPYTHCGCPLPGDTLGQRLARLKRRLHVSTPDSTGLIPPQRADALAATHASEHNSIYLGPHDDVHKSAARRARDEKMRRRRQRDEELVRKGKLDKDVLDRGHGHQLAFLYPVPFFAPPVLGCVSAGACGAGAGIGGFACAAGAGTCSGGVVGCGGGGALGGGSACGGAGGGGGCGGGGGGGCGGGGGGGGGCGGC